MSLYAQPKRLPARRPDYLRYVRSKPCMLCGKTWNVAAAHFGGHGIGEKASDWQTIPLCEGCHRKQGKLRVHAFDEKYHVNTYRVAFELLTSWLDMKYSETE